jgi:hypothetical protein
MALVVTSSATIVCAHGGRVTLAPRQTTVTAGGAPVLRETDIVGAPIVGCAQAPSVSTKPCTVVVSILPAGALRRSPRAACPCTSTRSRG